MLFVSSCRIVLKSNCDTPIDVWLVSGHHQHQQKEDDEAAYGASHPAVSSVQVKHEADGLAGKAGLQPHPQLAGLYTHRQLAAMLFIMLICCKAA